MSGALRWWMPPLLAVQFLTRIPVPGLQTIDADTVREGLKRSVVWFPAVGGLVGICTAVIILLADQFWPRAIAVVLALIFEARLTGAFHEDAVADFCDGFGGGQTRELIIDIMKDSRIGSYGALGLLVAVGLRAACLIELPQTILVPTIIASAAAGRWGAVWLMAFVRPVTQNKGLAKDIGQQVNVYMLAISSLLLAPFLLAMALFAPWAVAIAVGIQMVTFLWFRSLLIKHLSGVTGDCLGFFVYLSQLIWLLAALAWVN